MLSYKAAVDNGVARAQNVVEEVRGVNGGNGAGVQRGGNRSESWNKLSIVLSAPKGFIVGDSDGQRAGMFNDKIVGNLPLPRGRFYKPEAVAVRPLGNRNSGHMSAWLVRFDSEADVGKMLAYKPVIARHTDLSCIFIRQFYSEEVMQARKQIQDKAKGVASERGWSSWGLRWEGSLRGVVIPEGGGDRVPILWQAGKGVVVESMRDGT